MKNKIKGIVKLAIDLSMPVGTVGAITYGIADRAIESNSNPFAVGGCLAALGVSCVLAYIYTNRLRDLGAYRDDVTTFEGINNKNLEEFVDKDPN